ncbi:MAG: metallophosphoesterase [Lachnospiraceae bacterium]|nr:metallophosphoesterase [Lachnospiraceae bacterium]
MWPLWIALGVIGITGIVLLIRSEWERVHPVRADYEIFAPEIPEEAGPLRILFLSDLHGKIFPRNNEALNKILRETPCDLVLLGGDMMTKFGSGKKDRKALRSLLSGIPEGVPVYYASGNHEQKMLKLSAERPDWEPAFRKILREYGVRYLQNETVPFPVRGGEILLSAADLPRRSYKAGPKKPLPEGYLEEKIGRKDARRFTVLLLHSPLYLEEAADWGADLTLSGHFHGGTIRLFGRGLMTPQYQFFYPRCQGIFRIEGKTGIVSAGLGTHSVNVRLFDRPEVVLITLKYPNTAP